MSRYSKVAVVALDGLVQDGPSFARALDARGTPTRTASGRRHSAAWRRSRRTARSPAPSKASPSCSGQVVASAVRASRASPAGLRLGAVERLDQRGHAGHDAADRARQAGAARGRQTGGCGAWGSRAPGPGDRRRSSFSSASWSCASSSSVSCSSLFSAIVTPLLTIS